MNRWVVILSILYKKNILHNPGPHTRFYQKTLRTISKSFEKHFNDSTCSHSHKSSHRLAFRILSKLHSLHTQTIGHGSHTCSLSRDFTFFVDRFGSAMAFTDEKLISYKGTGLWRMVICSLGTSARGSALVYKVMLSPSSSTTTSSCWIPGGRSCILLAARSNTSHALCSRSACDEPTIGGELAGELCLDRT